MVLAHSVLVMVLLELQTQAVVAVVGQMDILVEQADLRLAGVAPLAEVESLMTDHRVARTVANRRRVGNGEVGRALQEARELLARGHVKRRQVGSKLVQAHPINPTSARRRVPGRPFLTDEEICT